MAATTPLPDAGGTQSVSPTTTTTYTVNANSPVGPMPPASVTVTVIPPGTVDAINHVIFMLQENHTFDNYFGMLNVYRRNNGYDMGARWNDIQRRRHRRQVEHLVPGRSRERCD